MDELEKNGNFTLSPYIIGPAMAIAVGLETIISFSTNLFVLLFTLSQYKILKESSNIILTTFTVTNLLLSSIYMPSIVITAVTEEWIFGSTLEQQVASCQFVGFIYLWNTYQMTFTLTAISVDRFLFIVKPSIYKRFAKPLVIFLLMIFVWFISFGMSLLYVVQFKFRFDKYIGTCKPHFSKFSWFIAVSSFEMIVCIGIIFVTTLWTFCFIRRVIKPHQGSENEVQDHLYNRRIKKIIGLFTALLITNGITFIPVFLTAIFNFAVHTGISGSTAIIPFQFYFFNTIMNPVMQLFFRRELYNFIVVWMRKLFYCIRELSTM